MEGGAGCRTDKQEDGCGMLRRPAVSLSVRQSESRENGGAAVPGMLGGGDDISFSIISGGRPRGKAMQHRRRGEEMERRELTKRESGGLERHKSDTKLDSSTKFT